MFIKISYFQSIDQIQFSIPFSPQNEHNREFHLAWQRRERQKRSRWWGWRGRAKWRAVIKGGKRKSGKKWKEWKRKRKRGRRERERGSEGKEIELCLEMHAATSGFGLKIRDVFDASMAWMHEERAASKYVTPWSWNSELCRWNEILARSKHEESTIDCVTLTNGNVRDYTAARLTP